MMNFTSEPSPWKDSSVAAGEGLVNLLYVATVHFTINAFLLPFARHFRSRGWRVDALAHGLADHAKCSEAFSHVHDIDWSRNPLALGQLRRGQATLRRLACDNNYDIVHVHTPVAAFVTRFAMRKRQKRPKVIYTAHGFHFHPRGSTIQNGLFLTLEKLAGRWTDYLVVINEEDRQAALRHRLVPPSRVRYMPGIGVEIGTYGGEGVRPAEVQRVREELGVSDGTPILLMIGEFNENKRHKDILRAFARLGKDSAHLVLAGTGKLENSMRRLATALKLDGRVHFLGFRRDIPVLLGASVATLIASTREGLPRSILESFCMGVPGIGSDIRGVRDLLAPDCGLLVPPGDIEGFARAMRWVVEHPEETRAMGKQARIRVENFETGRVLRMHEELYAEALQRESIAVGRFPEKGLANEAGG